MPLKPPGRCVDGITLARVLITATLSTLIVPGMWVPTFVGTQRLAAASQDGTRRPRPNGRGGQPAPATVVYTGVPGTIEGTIEDPLGGLMAGVTVRLTDALGVLVRSARSSSGATFEFAGLPPGAYSIDVAEAGFELTHLDVSVAEGERLSRAIVMRIDALEERLEITPAGPRTTPQPRTELERFLAIRNAPPAPPEGSRCAAPAPCVTRARKVVDRQPRYPSDAASAGIEGLVVLQARITRDGVIDEVRPLIAEDDRFRDAVVTAVREWQYEPARLNGTSIEMPLSITVEFSLK